MSLSTKILLGMGVGILAGVFFGEEAAFLKGWGEAFVQLLQMSVIPFVTISLIAGLGRLTYDQALSLAKKCGILLLILWAIAIATVAVMPLAFPDWDSASFFSPALVEEQKAVNFQELYIPANPFFSLANSIIPAVVVFSIAMGAALIGVENKQALLEMFTVLLDTLTRVTGFVVQLAPLGVFAIAAGAAGTMELEALGRLQVFLLAFIGISLVLTFYVLPVLVTSLTPLTFKEVVLPVRSALITAFATGNLIIILPILTAGGRQLLKEAELITEETESVVEVIVPTSFTFPTIGMLLSLSFVPFAGWYIGSGLSLAQYPTFLVSGLFSFFGGPIVAMPFLLDLLRIPADMFQLFVTVDVFTSRFGMLLAGMHVWALALLGSCAMAGRLRLRWMQLGQYALVSLVLTVATIATVRGLFTYVLTQEYTKYTTFVEMDLWVESAPFKVLEEAPLALYDPHRSRLDIIQKRGTLRVGYFKDALPFIFRNAEGKLVGLDVEMLHGLAKYLDVSLEFFLLLDREDVYDELSSGVCDIVVPGYAMSPGRTQHLTFSTPYMDLTLAFLVEDHRRDEFTTWEAVRSLKAPKIGLPTRSRYYQSMVRSLLPQAEVVPLESPREFLKGNPQNLDALAYSAETGSAWTLVYPKYTVAVPLPDPIVIPLAYPLPHGEQGWITFVDTWIQLKQKDGTMDDIFDHWILGKAAEGKEPRWSVMRNVLGWVE